jgi:hypothetical protein
MNPQAVFPTSDLQVIWPKSQRTTFPQVPDVAIAVKHGKIMENPKRSMGKNIRTYIKYAKIP